MKKFRKLTALLLVGIMLFALLAACNNDSDTNNGGNETPGTDTPETTTPTTDAATEDDDAAVDTSDVPYWLQPMQNRTTIRVGASFGTPEGDVPPGTTPETNTWNEIASEFLNIEFEYLWMVPSAQGEERFQLALATGEIPDIMRLNHQQFAEFSSLGMIRDLSDAYDRFIHPEIREMYEYFNNRPLEMSTHNGQLLGIPNTLDSFQQAILFWYRNDWLEALDLPVPTSLEMLYDTAVAFAQNDVSGHGGTTGLGLFEEIIHWGPDARAIFHGFGAYPEAWIERDGGLVYGTIQPETKEALDWMRRLYADGGINPEFATMNLDQLVADLTADTVGIVSAEWWISAWPLNHNLETNPDADWRAGIIFDTAGNPANTIITRNNIHDFLVVSANAPEGAEEALIKTINTYWDIHFSIGAREKYGELIVPSNGFVYNWIPAYVDLANAQYINYNIVHEAINTGDTSTFFMQGQWDLFDAYNHLFHGGPLPANRNAESTWGLFNSRIDPEGGWGKTMQVRERGLYIFDEYYGEPTATEIANKPILDDMWREFYARYIMGSIPESAWDTFVEDWLRLGGADWTREVNEQFDALR